jgi:hypothetical protein
MNVFAAMHLEDRELADLYSRWSEEYYSASWINNCYDEFVDWLLGGDGPLSEYEQEGVNEIRSLLNGRLLEMRKENSAWGG